MKTQGVDPISVQRCPTVCDAGPTIKQHCVAKMFATSYLVPSGIGIAETFEPSLEKNLHLNVNRHMTVSEAVVEVLASLEVEAEVLVVVEA